jgi:hypothetical protein
MGEFSAAYQESADLLLYSTLHPPKKQTHTRAQIYTYGDDVDQMVKNRTKISNTLSQKEYSHVYEK